MAPEHGTDSRIERLLAQDDAMSTFQFEEFRADLQVAIRELETRARRNHRAALAGVSVFVACVIAMPILKWTGWLNNSAVALTVAGLGTAAMFITAILAAIYQYRYQPALQRSQTELQSSTIAHLEQQVRELSKKQTGR